MARKLTRRNKNRTRRRKQKGGNILLRTGILLNTEYDVRSTLRNFGQNIQNKVNDSIDYGREVATKIFPPKRTIFGGKKSRRRTRRNRRNRK